MPQLTEYTFPSSDGKNEIRVREWRPDGAVKGSVQIAHGIAEYGPRYDGFCRFLAENGFAAAVNDHLGHGRTVRSREDLGFFAEEGGWELAVRDLHALHRRLLAEFPAKPAFLFGHSMGSFLTRTYLIGQPRELSGAIICGTGQQPGPIVAGGKLMAELEIRRNGARSRSDRLNALAFSSYNKGFEGRTPSDWLSRDPGIVDRYVEDPLCGFVPTAALFRDMMGGIRFISRQANVERMRKDLPVLFISGEKDPVGEYGKGVKRAFAAFRRAGMKDVTLKLYPDCRHELLNELNKDEVMADVLAWIEEKSPAAGQEE